MGSETFLECVEYLTDELSKTVWICAFEDSHSIKLCNQAENFFDIDSIWNDISKPSKKRISFADHAGDFYRSMSDKDLSESFASPKALNTNYTPLNLANNLATTKEPSFKDTLLVPTAGVCANKSSNNGGSDFERDSDSDLENELD